jgi:hypothetical protein
MATVQYFHATTNKKHAGVTEEGWDRMPDRAGTLREGNSIVLDLLSRSKLDPLKYAKEGNIANDNDEYAIGDNGNDEPLAEGNQQCQQKVCQG